MRACPETNNEIISALRQQLETNFYFRCLYERHFSRTKLFFIRKKISPDDALELTQEVFFSVYKKLDTLREASDFEAWVYRIALNIFRNHLEKMRVGKRAGVTIELENEDDEQDLLEKIAADVISPLDNLVEAEREREFRRAIAELPEQMRRVFYLKFVNELTNGEIAAALGISANTVKAHIFAARHKLREKLASSEKE